MGKIDPFVGISDEVGLVVGIGPLVEIGLFGGTGLIVSLTYLTQAIANFESHKYKIGLSSISAAFVSLADVGMCILFSGPTA